MIDNDQLLDRAFPGEGIPQHGSARRDRTCDACAVEWHSESDGEDCWVCGAEGRKPITPPNTYADAMAAMYGGLVQ